MRRFCECGNLLGKILSLLLAVILCIPSAYAAPGGSAVGNEPTGSPIEASVYTVQTILEVKDLGNGTSEFRFDYSNLTSFPDDFGSNSDYWIEFPSTVDYFYPKKAVFIGKVGTSPRELGRFTISELDATIVFCVPELPRTLKSYADENGYSVVKMYVIKSDPGKEFFYIDYACASVWFYKEYLRIDARNYIQRNTPEERWVVDFTDQINTLIKTSELPLTLSEIIFRNYGLSYIYMTSTPTSYYTIDYDKSTYTIYGGDPEYNSLPDESIEYTNTALKMSDKEAQWFVDYLRSVEARSKLPTDWSSIYQNYVLGGGYNEDYHSGKQDWEDTYYSDRFGLKYSMKDEEYYPIWFALYDMDRNGIPELLAYNGYSDGGMGAVYAFTIANNGRMKYLDIVGTQDGVIFYYDNDQYTGLFDETWHGGYHSIGYSYLDNGELENIFVASYTAMVDEYGDPSEMEILEERTNDEALWNLFINGTRKGVAGYTVQEIEQMSWEAFVENMIV